MTVLAPDGELGKRNRRKFAGGLIRRIGASAMARNAAGKNGPVKPKVARFKSGRKLPGLRLLVKAERRFEQRRAAPDQRPIAIRTGADDPLHPERVAKNLLSVGPKLIFAFEELLVARKD